MEATAIREWQTNLEKIYPNYGVNPDTMMVHVFTWCSELSRLLIRNSPTEWNNPASDRIDHSIVKGIAWIVAICNHYDIDLMKSILARFPGACPYCQLAPCGCDVQGRVANFPGSDMAMPPAKASEELADKIRSHQNVVLSFDQAVSHLQKIYPSNRTLLKKGAHAYVAAKLLEEGGELQAAYRQFELSEQAKRTSSGGSPAVEIKTDFKGAIAEEISDLTAWMLSCWNISMPKRSFDEEIESSFKLGCNTCHKRPCKCEPYHTSFNTEKALERFGDDIARARQALGESGKKILDEAEDIVAAAAGARTPEQLAELVKRADAIPDAQTSQITRTALDKLMLGPRR